MATGAKLAELQQAQDQVTAAKAVLESTRLLAPISGITVWAELVTGMSFDVQFILSPRSSLLRHRTACLLLEARRPFHAGRSASLGVTCTETARARACGVARVFIRP